MPLYEFECPQGHVTAEIAPVGTEHMPCSTCVAEQSRGNLMQPADITAKRIMSATRTMFRHNDRTSKL